MSPSQPGRRRPPRRPPRPTLLGPAALDSFGDPHDVVGRQEVATAAALALVGGTETSDREMARRVVSLADDHGLDLLASLWADSPPDSVPGALWRLYVVRAWVRASPVAAAREFAAGRRHVPVAHVVAGVAEPPGPQEVLELVDAVLTGVAVGDFAVTLERAAAFCRVVAAGRADMLDDDAESAQDQTAHRPLRSAARLARTAEHLESAARLWREGPQGTEPASDVAQRNRWADRATVQTPDDTQPD